MANLGSVARSAYGDLLHLLKDDMLAKCQRLARDQGTRRQGLLVRS